MFVFPLLAQKYLVEIGWNLLKFVGRGKKMAVDCNYERELKTQIN